MRSVKKSLSMFVLLAGLSGLSVCAAEVPTLTPWLNSNIDGVINRKDYADIPIEKLRKDDFYTAVNFDWLCDTGLAADTNSTSIFDEAQNRINWQMNELLKAHQLEGEVQEYYDMLNDWDTRTAEWKPTLKPHVQALMDIQNLEDMKAYLTSEEALYYGNVFHTYDAYEYYPDTFYLDIDTGYLYSCSAEEEPQYSAYKAKEFHDVSMILLSEFGYSREECEAIISNAISLEAQLSLYTLTEEEKKDPKVYDEEMYWPYTIDQLAESFTNYPIAEMLSSYGYTDYPYYVVIEPLKLWGLDKLFTEENALAFRDYILCTMLLDYSDYTGLDLYEKVKRASYLAYGYEECPSVEELIFERTISDFSGAMTDAYIDRFMSPEIKQDVLSLTEEIKDTYITLITQVEWLSEEAKATAIKKLESMDVFVAYPDNFEYSPESLDPGNNEQSLLPFVIGRRERFHDYLLYMMNFKAEANTDSPTESDEKQEDLASQASSFEVNAFYSPYNNAMVIPALMLVDSFYSVDMPKEEKLGKLGMIIAHEISHAFDPYGAQYDENGKQSNWWTEGDQEYYDKQINELVFFLNRLEVLPDGTTYDGKKVKDELIADILAMQCIIRMANKNINFDYRTFFEAYASCYGEKNTPDNEIVILETYHHPLSYLRVNITVSQFPEFRDAYHVKEGDGMYLAPEDRVHLWTE